MPDSTLATHTLGGKTSVRVNRSGVARPGMSGDGVPPASEPTIASKICSRSLGVRSAPSKNRGRSMSEKGVSSHAARRSPSDDPEQDFGGASPTISIGLPVWNGARYLADAIESILSQTFTDFELIISDNASTDDTAQIAQNFAERDRRIRYHRNEENIGGARNENLTFELSRGRYFRLSAYDDLVEPTLLERCVETLEQDPDAVLCFPETLVIDERGEVTHAEANTRGTASSPSQRFRETCIPRLPGRRGIRSHPVINAS